MIGVWGGPWAHGPMRLVRLRPSLLNSGPHFVRNSGPGLLWETQALDSSATQARHLCAKLRPSPPGKLRPWIAKLRPSPPNENLPCAKRCGRRDYSQYVQVRVEALWQNGFQSVKICTKINILIFAGLAAQAPIKDYHVQSRLSFHKYTT